MFELIQLLDTSKTEKNVKFNLKLIFFDNFMKQ